MHYSTHIAVDQDVAENGGMNAAASPMSSSSFGDGGCIEHTHVLTNQRRRTNAAGVAMGKVSRGASGSPSPVIRTLALAAASVARIGASP
jgi:hypothetical protein